MRTYPENIEELEKKHSFSLPITQQKIESIRSNIILRHDIAYLILKSRILTSLKGLDEFENQVALDSFLDKKVDSKDRLKIYNRIKNQIPLPMKESKNLTLYFLFLSVAFLLPWIIYLIFTTKEGINIVSSFTNLKTFLSLFLIGVLLVATFDAIFGRFFKSNKPPVDTRALTIRKFICDLIGQNKNDIKEQFEIIFKEDLEKLNNK